MKAKKVVSGMSVTPPVVDLWDKLSAKLRFVVPVDFSDTIPAATERLIDYLQETGSAEIVDPKNDGTVDVTIEYEVEVGSLDMEAIGEKVGQASATGDYALVSFEVFLSES